MKTKNGRKFLIFGGQGEKYDISYIRKIKELISDYKKQEDYKKPHSMHCGNIGLKCTFAYDSGLFDFDNKKHVQNLEQKQQFLILSNKKFGLENITHANSDMRNCLKRFYEKSDQKKDNIPPEVYILCMFLSNSNSHSYIANPDGGKNPHNTSLDTASKFLKDQKTYDDLLRYAKTNDITKFIESEFKKLIESIKLYETEVSYAENIDALKRNEPVSKADEIKNLLFTEKVEVYVYAKYILNQIEFIKSNNNDKKTEIFTKYYEILKDCFIFNPVERSDFKSFYSKIDEFIIYLDEILVKNDNYKIPYIVVNK